MKLAAIVLATLLVAAPAFAQPSDVLIVRDESTLTGCQVLGEVRSSSSWGGVMAGYAQGKALAGLKKKAVRLGATHLVLLDGSSGWSGSYMLGQAYRCPPKSVPPASAQ